MDVTRRGEPTAPYPVKGKGDRTPHPRFLAGHRNDTGERGSAPGARLGASLTLRAFKGEGEIRTEGRTDAQHPCGPLVQYWEKGDARKGCAWQGAGVGLGRGVEGLGGGLHDVAVYVHESGGIPKLLYTLAILTTRTIAQCLVCAFSKHPCLASLISWSAFLLT